MAKCSHVYLLSDEPLLPAHSLSSLTLSSSTYTPTLSFVSVRRSEHQQVIYLPVFRAAAGAVAAVAAVAAGYSTQR